MYIDVLWFCFFQDGVMKVSVVTENFLKGEHHLVLLLYHTTMHMRLYKFDMQRVYTSIHLFVHLNLNVRILLLPLFLILRCWYVLHVMRWWPMLAETRCSFMYTRVRIPSRGPLLLEICVRNTVVKDTSWKRTPLANRNWAIRLKKQRYIYLKYMRNIGCCHWYVNGRDTCMYVASCPGSLLMQAM